MFEFNNVAWTVDIFFRTVPASVCFAAVRVPVGSARAMHNDDDEDEEEDDAYEDVEDEPEPEAPPPLINHNLSVIVEQSGLYSDDMDFSFNDGTLSIISHLTTVHYLLLRCNEGFYNRFIGVYSVQAGALFNSWGNTWRSRNHPNNCSF